MTSSTRAQETCPISQTFPVCPICSSGVKEWRDCATRYGEFHIARCTDCGFAFVNPRPPYEWLVRYYSERGHGHNGARASVPSAAEAYRRVLEREQRSPNSTVDAARMIATIRTLSGNGHYAAGPRLLDVGCGYGFFSREALWSGFDVTSLEVASLERQVAARIIGKEPIASSFEDYRTTAGGFDVVLMSQVLEHAWDVNQWIEEARHSLTDGGILAIAVPNFGSVFRIVLGQRDPYVAPPSHLNFFTLGSLRALLEKHGFRVRQAQWVTRIPPSAVTKRLPSVRRAQFLLELILRCGGWVADRARLGMMVSVYGERT